MIKRVILEELDITKLNELLDNEDRFYVESVFDDNILFNWSLFPETKDSMRGYLDKDFSRQLID